MFSWMVVGGASLLHWSNRLPFWLRLCAFPCVVYIDSWSCVKKKCLFILHKQAKDWMGVYAKLVSMLFFFFFGVSFWILRTSWMNVNICFYSHFEMLILLVFFLLLWIVKTGTGYTWLNLDTRFSVIDPFTFYRSFFVGSTWNVTRAWIWSKLAPLIMKSIMDLQSFFFCFIHG